MQTTRKGQRGYLLAITMFALLALCIAGVSAVKLAGNEAEMAGNLRRTYSMRRCADGTAQAIVTQLPNIPASTDPLYSFAPDAGVLGQPGHVSNNNFVEAPAAALPVDALSGVIVAGTNVTNRAATTAAGQQLYRIVTTCTDATGAKVERETAVMYGVGH